MERKQVLWRRNRFEEISSEWETQAEASELSWFVFLQTEKEKSERDCKLVAF